METPGISRNSLLGGGFLGSIISDIRDNHIDNSVFRPSEKEILVSFTIFVSESAEMCTIFPFSAMKIGQFPTSAIFGNPPFIFSTHGLPCFVSYDCTFIPINGSEKSSINILLSMLDFWFSNQRLEHKNNRSVTTIIFH